MKLQRFLALVRRELWERNGFIRGILFGYALIAFLGLVGLGFVAFFSETFQIRVVHSVTHPSGTFLFLALGTLFAVIALLRIAIYFIHTLHDERMDRSYLFWKSIPVSDTMTVGSKLATGLVYLPVVSWLNLIFTCFLLLLYLSIATSLLGHNFWVSFWAPLPLLSAMFYLGVIFLTLPLWFLPLFGWCLFCSAWASPRKRQSPMLAAILIPLVLLALEPILDIHILYQWFVHLFNPVTTLLVKTLSAAGWSQRSVHALDARWADWAHLFTQPEFWWGILIGLFFISLAVYVRHRAESHR